MALPPDLSDDERRAALNKAIEARRARAELKVNLKTGSLTFPQVIDLAESNDVVAKTKVLTVLEALPGVGKVKARRMMSTIGISESRRLRGLGDQQRQHLLERLAG